MNREILFRGKQIDNGEWIEGIPIKYQSFPDWWNSKEPSKLLILSSLHDGEDVGIDAENYYEVDPYTVCQYTGLTDKNGVKIFEGDIVRMHYFFENYHPVTLGAFEDESEIICKLSVTPLGVYFESANMTGYLCDYLEDPEEELEVIGNAHDNQELLEENNT